MGIPASEGPLEDGTAADDELEGIGMSEYGMYDFERRAMKRLSTNEEHSARPVSVSKSDRDTERMTHLFPRTLPTARLALSVVLILVHCV